MTDSTEGGAGDVPLMLGGEHLIMKPSLEACRTIAKLANNSLTLAVTRVMERLDFEFVVEVVSIGINATSPVLKKQVAEKVYRQGVISVAADVVLYLRTIMNGGVRPKDDDLSRSIDLLDQLENSLPPDMAEDARSLDALRSAILERATKEDEETTDPLAESESRLENSTAS